jgi:cell division cycle 20-like protein 1 (cofactor of APC complex)
LSTAFLLSHGGNPFGSPTKPPRRLASSGEHDAIQGKPQECPAVMANGPTEEANRAYSRVLQTEIFGPSYSSADNTATAGASRMQTTSSPRSKGLLQFRSPSIPASSALPKCARRLDFSDASTSERYSLTPIRKESQAALQSPRKAPRHIAKVPFKILDAPGIAVVFKRRPLTLRLDLADDFYLNLIDWGAANILAVGLNTMVYLWSAGTSRVTKLCDVGPYDSVTSVQWMQRVCLRRL